MISEEFAGVVAESYSNPMIKSVSCTKRYERSDDDRVQLCKLNMGLSQEKGIKDCLHARLHAIIKSIQAYFDVKWIYRQIFGHY